MHWLDTLYLALITLAAALGAWTGLLWQAARLANLAVAGYATLAVHEHAAAWASRHVAQGASETVIHLLAYAVVFLGVYIVLFLLTRLLYGVLTAVDLQGVDRWGGALLGAGKMVLLLAAFSLAAAHCPHPTAEKWLHESTMAPILARGLEKAIAEFPDDYKSRINHTWHELGAWVQRNPAPQEQAALERGGKI